MNTLLAVLDIPENIAGNLPKNFITLINFAWVLWFFLSRAFKNWKAGGGLYGIKQALLWGDKTADAKAVDEQKDAAHIKPKTGLTPAPFPPPTSDKSP